jgi:hypothetical protein
LLCNLHTTTEIGVYILFGDTGISFARDSMCRGREVGVEKVYERGHIAYK